MSETETLIIGAGPAGLTCAYTLSQAGKPVTIIEASPFVGGMARSFKLWGHIVDHGPHRFFSSHPKVLKVWDEIIGTDYETISRKTRIYFHGKFFSYPLKTREILSKLGPGYALLATISYIKAKLLKRKNSAASFENWVVGNFGRHLFETFFKDYSEKLWGLKCHELDQEFAAQRIKKLNFLEVLISTFGKNRHRSLTDQFQYPLQGNGEVYEKMREKIMAAEGSLRVSETVQKIILADNVVKGVVTRSGELINCRNLVSSMPLTLLAEALDPPQVVRQAIQNLEYRNTILVYLKVNRSDLFPDQWLYIQSPDLLAGRVTNYRNWSSKLPGDSENSVLSVEYWCSDHESMWTTNDEELINLATQELIKANLINQGNVCGGHVVRLRRSYPVYRLGYRKHLKVVSDFIDQFKGIYAIGRYGAFKYNNQDHSILMGLQAAEIIQGAKDTSLWQINTDSDEYLEIDNRTT